MVERQCWAASGNICEVCGERCPVRPKAIHVIQGQAAAVSTSECTGCGVCAYLCPADAIRIEPPHAGE
ncbi:MAG: ATP-binding protein [Planctomycetota bacterium]